jgi:hypothetical protein
MSYAYTINQTDSQRRKKKMKKKMQYKVVVQGVRDWFTQIEFSFSDKHEAELWRDYEIDIRGNRAWLIDYNA